LLSKYKL